MMLKKTEQYIHFTPDTNSYIIVTSGLNSHTIRIIL